jgi:hypothetical protein
MLTAVRTLYPMKIYMQVSKHGTEVGHGINSEEISIQTRVKSIQGPPSEGGH